MLHVFNNDTAKREKASRGSLGLSIPNSPSEFRKPVLPSRRDAKSSVPEGTLPQGELARRSCFERRVCLFAVPNTLRCFESLPNASFLLQPRKPFATQPLLGSNCRKSLPQTACQLSKSLRSSAGSGGENRQGCVVFLQWLDEFSLAQAVRGCESFVKQENFYAR